MKPLFTLIEEAEISYDHHESDLYLPATPEVGRLMRETGTTGKLFWSQTDKTMWVDIPFAYLPWWEARAKKAA